MFGDLRVTPVSTSHDAAEPVAFVFDDGRHCAAYCTDTGRFTTLLAQRLQGCELLLLETNHDSDMLRNGPYPWPLKQRIHSTQRPPREPPERGGGRRAPIVGPQGGGRAPPVGREQLPRRWCTTPSVPRRGTSVPVTAVTRNEMLRVGVNGDGATLERRELP